MYSKYRWIACVFAFVLLSACNAAEKSTQNPTESQSSTIEQATQSKVEIPAQIDAQNLFDENCASCHMGGVPKAPHFIEFQIIGPDTIKTALTSGVMKQQAAHLSTEQVGALAAFLGGTATTSKPVKMCKTDTINVDGASPVFEGWGLTLEGTRYIPDAIAKLSKGDVSKLSLKWAFAYPNATRARSQPVVFADHILVGGQDGRVFALDFETGCATWTFQADAEVRNAVNIAKSKGRDIALFGDIKGHVYAIDANTGKLIWRKLVNDHPDVTLTGSPRLYKEFLYVPLSSKEWASAADPGYECCTFRGGVVKMDIHTGDIRWTTYTIPQKPEPTGELNSEGARRFQHAGVPIWNSPTIDEKRGVLYAGTGESYTSPAAPTSDSVLAIDLESGDIRWHYQSIAGDAWNMACFIGGGPNCPEENGPDLDIGAPPVIMTTSEGKDIIAVGQKSGDVFALDPDNKGALLWRKKIGRGGFNGGVHWGIATNGTSIFAPIADTAFSEDEAALSRAGLYSLDPINGEINWKVPAADVCEELDKPACDPGLSAAVTAINGVVFAGAFDGHLRAYDTGSGEILWDFNTNREFKTINGEIAKGGSIESDGPIVFDGHVLVNSGYLFGSRMPGNVLLAFSVHE